MADLALNVMRIDRGRYGCSGFIEFKTDLHDNEVRVGVIVQRSFYRSGPYKILPMKVENETLPIIFYIYSIKISLWKMPGSVVQIVRFLKDSTRGR